MRQRLLVVALPLAIAFGASPSRAEPPAVPAPLPAPAGAAASPAASAMPDKPNPEPGMSTWNIDADHSDVGFTIKHMMVSNVRGSFHGVVGAVQWHDKDISKSTVELELAVASLDTHVQKRDDHLRSPEFFDAAKFPKITFKSTKISKRGKDLQIAGDLTIRDVTKKVMLKVNMPPKPFKDPFGLTRTAVAGTTKINRKDFGLKWNQALETGGVLVGDEVNVELAVELVKKG